MINDPIKLANPVCSVPWCDKTCTWNIGDSAVTPAACDGILSRQHQRVWPSGVSLSLFEAPCTDTAPQKTYVFLPESEFENDTAWSDMDVLQRILQDAAEAAQMLDVEVSA